MLKKQHYVIKIILLGLDYFRKFKTKRKGKRREKRKEEHILLKFFKDFIDNTFIPDYKSTVGVQFMTRTIEIDDNKVIRIVFWDIDPKPKFHSYRNLFYKDAEGAILIFDLIKEQDFEEMKKMFYEIKRYAESYDFILIGYKRNLMESAHEEVNIDIIREFIKNEGGDYLEVTPETIAKIEDAIIELVRKMIKTFHEKKN